MFRARRCANRDVGRRPSIEGLEDRRLLTSIRPGSGIVSLIEFQPNSSRSILENAGRQVFTVVRTGDLSGAATVRVHTEAGTALAEYDFRSFETILTFAPGESRLTFSVDVIDDQIAETPFKSFTVLLSDPTGGAGLDQTSAATVIIQDDEPASMLPLMVVDFGAYGVWAQDAQQGFRKISGADAQSVLASANRMGYLDLGQDGLWAWDSLRGLRKISDADADAIYVVNNDWTRAEDVLLADFGASGLWRFSESQGWRQLSGVDPQSIVVDRQTVFIDFGHGGLWRWGDDLPWYKLNDVSPEGIAADNGTIFLDYGPSGLWTWSVIDGWANISTGDPQSIALGGGRFYADYGAAGLWAWTKGGAWAQLGGADPRSMVAAGDELYVDYGGYGLWVYSTQSVWGRGPRKIANGAAESMAFSLRGNRMIVDLGPFGLRAWEVDDAVGRTIINADPESFSVA